MIIFLELIAGRVLKVSQCQLGVILPTLSFVVVVVVFSWAHPVLKVLVNVELGRVHSLARTR